MGFVARAAGVVPLAGALAAATALAGVAVFTVNSASCADPGQYVQRGGQVELVGGCVDPADLPAVPGHQPAPADAGHAEGINRIQQVRP